MAMNQPGKGYLISIAVFGPVEWFALLASGKPVTVEVHEHYIKQTWRNRYRILTANGPLDLPVPVIKTLGNHTPVSRITIDRKQPWWRNHWRAIQSAYTKSPWFIHFAPDLEGFLFSEFRNLTDIATASVELVRKWTGLEMPFIISDHYIENPDENFLDLRNRISPKKAPWITPPPYYQVFSDRFGFVPGLSILDLVFNLGPETAAYLHSIPLPEGL
ncbi:MAG: WbqC family protein [Bacteroidales bacterium]